MIRHITSIRKAHTMQKITNETDVWENSNSFRGYLMMSVNTNAVSSLVTAFNGKIRIFEPRATNDGIKFERTLDKTFSEEGFRALSKESDDCIRIAINNDSFQSLIHR